MGIRGLRTSRNRRKSSSPPPPIGSLLGTTVFGIIFTSFALVMGVLVFKDYRADKEILEWVQTPCVIEKSGIDISSDGEYSFSSNYSYEWEGRNYISGLYQRNSQTCSFNSVEEKGRILRRYPVGTTTTCFVNPSSPSMAVLTRDDGSFPWSELLFMVPFVVAGLGVAVAPWVSRSRKKRSRGFESPTQKNLSSKRAGRIVMIVSGAVFVAAGIAVSSRSLSPLQEWRASASWVETQAVVTVSAVRENSDSDGTTYYPYIAYSYQFNGKTYEGDKYEFFKVSSSGYKGKAEIVRSYPVGEEIRVYIDPENPVRSVINRDAAWAIVFYTLFPFIFIGAGLALVVAGLRFGCMPANGFDSHAKNITSRDRHGNRKPPVKNTTRHRIFGTGLFALIWNGFISIFVYQAWLSIKTRDPEWFLIIFLIPFVVVGFVAIGALLAEVFRLSNPKIEIIPDSGSFSLDNPIRLSFRATGSMHRIISLKITLHGVEKISVSDGDSNRPEENEFFTETLLETSNPHEMTCGELEVELPPDAMHSFRSDRASIEWRLKVVGSISKWPDIKDELILEVLPSEGGSL